MGNWFDLGPANEGGMDDATAILMEAEFLKDKYKSGRSGQGLAPNNYQSKFDLHEAGMQGIADLLELSGEK